MPFFTPMLPGPRFDVLPYRPAPHWPGLSEMRGATHTRRSNIGRQLKLGLALWMTQVHRARFDAVLSQHSHWRPVFVRQAKSFEPLLQSFMDRRFGMAQRFTHLQHDLITASQVFGPATGARIALGERVLLWTLPDGGTLRLGLNGVCKREGLWALSLDTAGGVQVCQISFSFLHTGQLMLGSVQGAAAQDEVAMQGIRELTRAAEGLRPPYLLAEVLRTLCKRWSLDMLGVDPQHHVKKRWHQQTLAVSFDYCGFWAELGGHRQTNGIWSLPLQRPLRDLAEVPTKRRAQYKRKLALLADLPQQLQHLPSPSPKAQAAQAAETG